MLTPYSNMCVRAAISMVLTDLETQRSAVPVQIVSIIPTILAGKLPASVPTHVHLPR